MSRAPQVEVLNFSSGSLGSSGSPYSADIEIFRSDFGFSEHQALAPDSKSRKYVGTVRASLMARLGMRQWQRYRSPGTRTRTLRAPPRLLRYPCWGAELDAADLKPQPAAQCRRRSSRGPRSIPKVYYLGWLARLSGGARARTKGADLGSTEAKPVEGTSAGEGLPGFESRPPHHLSQY